ncbi:MAG: hypothetical protein AAFV26_03590, partial [Pseudomonadota bacterium]
MRHALGVLGVLAAGVLLAVSAAMNWRFGYQLGTTEFDGIIYGSASAAADCLKALVPFFIFAAVKNRMWSQAAASAVVWLVVTAYSLTSALGHAALNRQDTAGQRAAEVATYSNLQADLKRAKEQLSWVPQHRPAAMVQSEISGMQARKPYKWSNGCTNVKGRTTYRFCKTFTALKAELGAAEQAAKLESRIERTQSELAKTNGAGLRAADPQAQILADLTGAFLPGVSVENVQTALAVFIALLLEVGSGLGMYIAFSQWRLGGVRRVEVVEPKGQVSLNEAIRTRSEPALPMETVVPPEGGANDNTGLEFDDDSEEDIPIVASLAPQAEGDDADEDLVSQFSREHIRCAEGSNVTFQHLYEEFCAFCVDKDRADDIKTQHAFYNRMKALGFVRTHDELGIAVYAGYRLRNA